MQGKFISLGLVDGSIIGGGGAVFLPDHMKMESMLKEVRSRIAINGPKYLGLLMQALRSVTAYQNLANEINKKYVEVQNQGTVNKNTAKVNKDPVDKRSTGALSKGGVTSHTLSPTTPPSHSPGPTLADLSRITILGKDVSMDVVVKVAPKVASRWMDIGYCLRINPEDLDVVEAETHGDLRVACRKMLRKWISSGGGRTPKTWKTFLEVLIELGIDPSGTIAVLEKETVRS